MSKRVILIAAAAIAAVVWSAPAKAEVAPDFDKATCDMFYQLAKYSMSMRQNEYSYSDAKRFLSKNVVDPKSKTEEARSLLEGVSIKVLTLAYEEPVWPLQEFKNREITQFANNIEFACYRGLAKVDGKD